MRPDAQALPALVDAIDAVLPQTQCTRCGYPDCRGYAQAIATGEADINRCPPGGAEGVVRLAAVAGRALRPLDAGCGAEGPRRVALIIENACIGCTRCIDACPVDCIVGAAKQMHTVIESLCTGCELCLPACPVDCIALEDVTPGRSGWAAWSPALAAHAQARYQVRTARRDRDRLERTGRLEAHRARPAAADDPAAGSVAEGRRATIEAARIRARTLRDSS